MRQKQIKEAYPKAKGLYRNVYGDNTRINKGVDKADKEYEQDRQTDGCLKQVGMK